MYMIIPFCPWGRQGKNDTLLKAFALNMHTSVRA